MSRRKTPPSPFRQADDPQADQHPVDRAADQRVPARRLKRRLRRSTARLADALGDQRPLWLRVDELLNEHRIRRQEAYFDLGYEHGVAAGRAEALRRLAGPWRPAPAPPAARAFADRIRTLAVQAGLPAPLVAAALLETAWALAPGLPNDPAPDAGRRT